MKLNIALLCLLCSSVYSQDHLEPVVGYFSSADHWNEYYPTVRTLLLGKSGNSMAQVVVVPSFSPEYAIAVDQSGETYYVSVYSAVESIWYSKSRNSIKVVSLRKKIDRKCAESINNLFFSACSRVSYDKEAKMELDGTTYFFSAFKLYYGMRNGQTCSPERGTLMARLVEISDLLLKFTNDGTQVLEKDIYDKSEDLLKKLSVK